MEDFSTNPSHGYLGRPSIFTTTTQIFDTTETDHHYGGGAATADVGAMKAKIVAHPHYPRLLSAYIDCQKVGATPEVVEQLSAMAAEFEARWPTSMINITDDPELDQFMEAYYRMLVGFREELSRPIQEAMDFLKHAESQLSSMITINGGSSSSLLFCSSGACSSKVAVNPREEADQPPVVDPRAEERELKHRLLKKYGGHLGSLRQELSKKKTKGKLPKEARQKLLGWWNMNYQWPYPSDAEKMAMAESTGLDQRQINNWFVNQRKRHWKPSEEMQFVVEGYNPHNTTTPFCIQGCFMADSATYRFGP